MQIVALGYGETPPWLALPPTGDGIEKVILTEQTMKDEPNTCWDNVVGGTSASCSHHTEYAGTVNWTPSTGVSQCLGELRVARVTNIYFTSDAG